MDPLQRSRMGQVSVQSSDGQQGAIPFNADLYRAMPALYSANPSQLLGQFTGANGQFVQHAAASAFDPLHQLTTLYDTGNGQPLDLNSQNGHHVVVNQHQLPYQQLPHQPNPTTATFRVSSQQPIVSNPALTPQAFYQLSQQQPSTTPTTILTPRSRSPIFVSGERWRRIDLDPQQSASTIEAYNNPKLRSLFQFESEDVGTPESDSSAQHKSKRARTEKEPKEPVKARRPSDPIESLRWEASQTLSEEDDDLSTRIVRYNDLMTKAESLPMKRVLVEILENQRSETIATIGKMRLIPLMFQRWLVNIYNTHKNKISAKDSDGKADPETDQLANGIFKVLGMMEIRASDIEKYKLDKVSSTFSKKWPAEGTKRMAAVFLEKGKKYERQKAKEKDSEPKDERSDSLKRKSEEEDNASAKRLASSSAASSGSKPTPSSAPSAAAQQTNTILPPKKPGNSQFFKALQPTKATVTKPPAPAAAAPAAAALRENKPAASTAPTTAPTPAAATSTSTFSSIFDQLKERQRKDEEAKVKRTDNPDKTVKEVRKKKVKKSVTWKNEADLVEVKLFEVLEPEGEYYGGGMGDSHEWGDARGLDVAEGRDAKEALRNRKLLEEEEDEFIDWYTPIAIDTAEFYAANDSAQLQAYKRLGETKADAPDAKMQAAREAGVLMVTYYSPRDIPFSPGEPENDGISGPHDDNKPIIMKLSDAPVVAPELNSLLSQFAQPEPAPPPVPDANPAAAILQSLQAFAPPAQQQQAAVDPLGSLLASLVGAQAAPAPQAAAPAVDINALIQSLAQQPAQQAQPANAISALLATIAGAGAADLAQQQQHHQPPVQSSWNDHGSSSRWDEKPKNRDVRRKLREQSGWTDEHERNNSTSHDPDWKWRKEQKEKFKGMKKSNKPCQFYRDGKCRMGKDCRFLHIDE